MQIHEITTIDREEWLKLLHVSGSPDEQLAIRMNDAERQLLDAASPRGIYRVVECSQLPLEGVSIQKHLEGCPQAAILAVTCGSGIDSLLRRAQIRDMAAAVILDAGASVLTEHIADAAVETMQEELEQLYMTPRFSPGYGDYPLRCQRKLLELVDAHRRVGITLTPANMMLPGKSISALIGLSEYPVKGRLAPCSECILQRECSFLKEGRHC